MWHMKWPIPIGTCMMLAVAQPVLVTVDSGVVEGFRSGDGAVFLGIPFAARPTGDSRWKPPQPVPKWRGKRPAIDFGPICPQSAEDLPGLKSVFDETPPTYPYHKDVRMYQNCLSLNVLT